LFHSLSYKIILSFYVQTFFSLFAVLSTRGLYLIPFVHLKMNYFRKNKMIFCQI